MDFSLTESQELLLSTARGVFQQHCPTTFVQELALSEHGFADDLWRRISELGWPGLMIPETFGGSGGSLLDIVLLVEQMGYACFPSPYLQSAVVCTSILLNLGSSAQQQRLLPPMARGERICTLAILEESASFAPDAIALTGDAGGKLNGAKLFVKDAHIADDLIVVTRSRNGVDVNVFLMETATPGVSLQPVEVISDEKLFEVTFNNVPLTEAMQLGLAGSGWSDITPALQLGALVRCAEMVGCAQRILDICSDYTKVREQSGRPIGAFQAIQHHCADLLRHVEASRGLLYNAAWRHQESMSDSAAAIATAKAYAHDAGLWVARKGHQIMGAIGYCEEHPMHLFHKRIQAAGLDFGDAAMHVETVAQSIGLATVG
ncbi:acyl-CoA dehydrogenase family protein [Candidatus Entotheonella palauensis]|uniref:acyl-CoA dehydrogenase family protein n=1 Tax=Candidatus Entotheonella palauensis TaxID=93172 RepID=UPI000B7CCBAB|nr:acyl-CoA dehydrogenase family protein [Candidatus Entotheonella palauensis]